MGEGIAQAEVVAWHVALGDEVAEDQPMADVMTDKATVELTSPGAGKPIERHGDQGERVAVGAELVVFETEGAQGDRGAGRIARGRGAGSWQTGARQDAWPRRRCASARAALGLDLGGAIERDRLRTDG